MKIDLANRNGAIKGFNREWAAVKAIRDRRQQIIGWEFMSACDLTGRHFTSEHWDDPHGAAMHAMETHRCTKDNAKRS